MTDTFFDGLKGWKLYLLGYGALLVLSHLVIGFFESPIENEKENYPKIKLQAVRDNLTTSNQEVQITYRDLYNGTREQPPVLVLLPGGPEGPEVFDQLTPKLTDRFRVIIPYLPGFGTAQKQLPDYSFQALASYAEQLLSRLEIPRAHLVGYGLGGASAIYMGHDQQDKVQSLTLISSIGVQELELLGSYTLNHAIYGIQLAAIWLLHNAVPHFGLFDALGVNVPYAKSYYESDQRPIREYLKQYEKPMLILHGRSDPLVPAAVAREHHRIVPQSRMKLYDADHDLVETHSDSVSKMLSSFIKEVVSGETNQRISPERIAESQKPFSNVEFARFKGVSLVIIMLIIIVATLVSEDLTCIGAGLLAARGLIGFWPATLACFLGIFAGDIGLYLIGRFMGRKAVRKAPFKWFISEADLEKSARWFSARGPAIIVASRFLPGSRLPTYFSAGVVGAGFWMFTTYFLLAAIVWTPLLVGISKLIGNELLRYFHLYRDYAIWVFLGAVALLILCAKFVIPAFSYRGRRMLISRYRRLTRWEYWSPFILYAPVFCYVLYLGMKYRCMTLFTATNPAIPDGGFVGESKTEILRLFDCNSHVAEYALIPLSLEVETRLSKADDFMEEYDLQFPVVLKPDMGQRGQGVQIIKKRTEMQEYLRKAKRDTIIQEYIEGTEYGIFYYREPGQTCGKIFSITEKELLTIKGDGERTLEELILDDDRAVSLAKFHLKKNGERLYDIPEEGEQIPIVELGTHAKGAIFYDGAGLITQELVSTMNSITEAVDGFYFGRFDIRAPGDEALKEGAKLKIVEVNGVTSEATNIYDPQYSFLEAEQILMKQWKLAFEIGRQNTRNGTESTPFVPFMKRTAQALLRLKRSR